LDCPGRLGLRFLEIARITSCLFCFGSNGTFARYNATFINSRIAGSSSATADSNRIDRT
jgi:hypothetical protein